MQYGNADLNEPADEPPPIPTIRSNMTEVKQWLRWFLANKTELSLDARHSLVNKLVTDGQMLLSFTEAQWREFTDIIVGSLIFNALHGMKIALRMHRRIDFEQLCH